MTNSYDDNMYETGGFYSVAHESAEDAETLTIPNRKLEEKIRKNVIQVQRSGLSPEVIMQALGHTGTDVDAAFMEAVLQFQQKNYLDPREHDGILGQSTLDTLGLFDNGLKARLNSSGYYGQKRLNEIRDDVAASTNNEFNAANWYEHLVKPAWLGIKIAASIHVLLWRKLKEVQDWLLTQPQYSGKTPAELGTALGMRTGMSYSGARLSEKKEAMHGFGLAIDIDGYGNPWIGAGWIQGHPENEKFIDTLRNASGEKLKGKTIAAYLDTIAQRVGSNTRETYNELKRKNDEFISYLARNAEQKAYWQKSATFGKRDPMKGFLNLHPDLVFALREHAGLAWGAIDFGDKASGDIMHFDMRTLGVGRIIGKHIRAAIPTSGHPTVDIQQEWEEASDDQDEITVDEYHEAIEEADWLDETN